jgi:[ribosomal protein S5]-alanine N-acetyltransferase
MDPILCTPRLALRAWALEDADEMFAIYADPRVWRFLSPSADYADVATTRVRLATTIESIATRGYGHWAVVENEGGALVGSCGFRAGFEDKELEVGFTIAPPRWGRGYATEIASAVVDLGFERFGAARIWSLTSPANLPSRKVLAKIGMRHVKDLEDDGETWAVYVRTAPQRDLLR